MDSPVNLWRKVCKTGPSLTVYKGEEQMNHLFESGLFDTETVSRTSAGSFIISVSAEPVEEALILFAGYLSKPHWRSH